MPDRPAYDPRAAWRRAFTYFAVCWVVALATGALASLPGAFPVGDRGFVVWGVAALAVVVVGYWVVWPIGTLTHGRPYERRAVWTFGLAWGISEGLLMLSVWVVADRWLPWGVALVTALVIVGAYLGLWHALYWDVRIAPEHNIEAWNLRKVLFVHVPNLAVTVPWLATYGCTGAFVAVQTVGLLGAARAMHMPKPGSTDPRRRERH